MRNNIKNDMSIPTVNYDGWYFFCTKIRNITENIINRYILQRKAVEYYSN